MRKSIATPQTAIIAPVIDFYVRAEFEFHFKNHQAEADTSNCVEGPQDLMQKLGIITDDKLIKKFTAEKFFGGEPKTMVRLLAMEA